MLNPEDRLLSWQNFHQRIKDLFRDVDDELCSTFAPLGKTHDLEAPFYQKLYSMLEELYDFSKQHIQKLEHEFCTFDMERSNAHVCFEAWYYGLCPNVLKENNLLWTLDYQHIAKFKQSQNISRDDTIQAVELWRQQNISRSA